MYYTYILLNPCKPGKFVYENVGTFAYEPFYVGKGKGKRCYDHFKESCSGNKHKFFTIKKIKNKGMLPIIVKIIDGVEEQQALDIEIKVISSIGRSDLSKGPLTNLTDGGDSLRGYIFTQAWKDRQSKARLTFLATEKGKQMLLENSKKVKKFYNSDAGIVIREQKKKRMHDFYNTPKGKDSLKLNGKLVHDFYQSEKGQEINKHRIENLKKYYKTEKGVQRRKEISQFSKVAIYKHKYKMVESLEKLYKTERWKNIVEQRAISIKHFYLTDTGVQNRKQKSEYMVKFYQTEQGLLLKKLHSERCKNRLFIPTDAWKQAMSRLKKEFYKSEDGKIARQKQKASLIKKYESPEGAKVKKAISDGLAEYYSNTDKTILCEKRKKTANTEKGIEHQKFMTLKAMEFWESEKGAQKRKEMSEKRKGMKYKTKNKDKTL